MSVRQRRGKKDSSTSITTSQTSNAEDENSAPVQEQIDKAYLSVVTTREKTKELHAKWRDYLFKMSLMALFLCVHQIHGPMVECLMEMKEFNEGLSENGGDDNTANEIPFLQAILIIMNDSMCEFMGLLLVAFTAYFTALRDPPGTFSSWQYLCANAIVPLQLALFYQTKNRKGCIPQGPDMELLDLVDEEGNVKERSFPIAIIMNVIVSAAYWLMKSGMDQCDANVDTVEKLRKQLKEAQEKNREAKNTAAAAAAKKKGGTKK